VQAPHKPADLSPPSKQVSVSLTPAAQPLPPAAKVQAPKKPAQPEKSQTRCGTAVDFVKDPSEAARLASQKGRLQFILHVSGDFEDAQFT
jgi:hypothetical protein